MNNQATRALLQDYADARDQHGADSPQAVDARNKIVEHNLGLCFAVWRRCARHRIEYDDVLSVAVPGLIRAIERFDLARGTAFSTYATWWIRHGLCRSADETGDLIRTPSYARSRANPPKTSDIREAAAAAMRQVCSLDRPLSDEDTRTTFGDTLADEQARAAFDHIVDADEHAALRAAMATLPEEEREVLEARASGEHQAALAARLGMSRDRLRQLEAHGAAKVRRLLAA